MRARDIVGRRIASVEHVWLKAEAGRPAELIVSRIILDNGTALQPMAVERDDSVEATMLVHKRRRVVRSQT